MLRDVVHGVIDLVQGAAAEVHGRHGVADERVQRGAVGLAVAAVLAEVQVLAGDDGFCRCKIGIHPLPAARQGAAVEDALEATSLFIQQKIRLSLNEERPGM